VPAPTISTSGTFDPGQAYAASSATGGTGIIPVEYTYTTAAGCVQTVYTNVQIDSVGPTPTKVNTISSAPTLHIYPNPTNDILYIDIVYNASYRMLSIVGQEIKEGTLNGGHNSIPVQSLPPGIYMLEITSNDGQKTVSKIIKQ
jgi:hypothetical protein